MSSCRVLVVGGYGFLGQRLVRRLARQEGLHVIGCLAAGGTRWSAGFLD